MKCFMFVMAMVLSSPAYAQETDFTKDLSDLSNCTKSDTGGRICDTKNEEMFLEMPVKTSAIYDQYGKRIAGMYRYEPAQWERIVERLNLAMGKPTSSDTSQWRWAGMGLIFNAKKIGGFVVLVVQLPDQ
jgi:hypothetical protein